MHQVARPANFDPKEASATAKAGVHQRSIVRKPVEDRGNQAFGRVTKGGPVCANQKRSNCLVEFKDVTLHFGDKVIFDDLNLAIRSGECLVLLGPSGIGKSTLLRLLLETLRPECGSIYFDGIELTHLAREQ